MHIGLNVLIDEEKNMIREESRRVIGIDTGGTFTDVVSVDLGNKDSFIKKVSSTPEDPSIALMNGIEEINFKEIKRLIHGTTHATNTIITKTGAVTGMITTKGFRDVLEIMRGNRPVNNAYNLQREKDKHLIPRFLRVEVKERVDYLGNVIEPLCEEDVIKATEFLIKHGVTSIAICFIFSYMNPSHEKKAAEIINNNFEDLFVSTSASILPEWREYERFSTTVCDAYVKPKIDRYFSNILKKLNKKSYFGDFLIMKNNGGAMSSKMAARYPVETCLSGPAAGVVAAKYFGMQKGLKNIISLDMGGTSLDAGLIYNNDFIYTTETEITPGIPIKAAMVDIRTIGAGGGSIAKLDSGGVLKVGPQSAGANPGPACYGLGGKEPTITDANIVLGRLNPEYFLGGEMILKKRLAEEAILPLSKAIKKDLINLSKGIITTSVSNMVNEVRSMTTENGFDPREFVLLIAGGAGPLHGVQIAKELKIKKVMVPYYPGLMSAMGLLLSDLKFDNVKTYHSVIDFEEIKKIKNVSKKMLEEGIELIKLEGFKEEVISQISLDMRYLGQNYEINIPIISNKFSYIDICKWFEAEHKRLYGINLPELPIEVLRIRTSIIGVISNKIDIIDSIIFKNTDNSKNINKISSERLVYFDEFEKAINTKIYNRNNLTVKDILEGPTIIEEIDSTTFIPPKCKAIVDEYMNIIIDVN